MTDRRIEAERLVNVTRDDVCRVLTTVLPDRSRVHLEMADHHGLAIRAGVRVRIGPCRDGGRGCVWDLSWRPTKPSRLLPAFTGRLEVTDLGGGSVLVLSGTYRRPFGLLGAAVDRLALGRLAEESLAAFLADVGRAIEGRVETERERGPMRSPDYPPDLRGRHIA